MSKTTITINGPIGILQTQAGATCTVNTSRLTNKDILDFRLNEWLNELFGDGTSGPSQSYARYERKACEMGFKKALELIDAFANAKGYRIETCRDPVRSASLEIVEFLRAR